MKGRGRGLISRYYPARKNLVGIDGLRAGIRPRKPECWTLDHEVSSFFIFMSEW